MFHSILNYGLIACGGACRSAINPLQNLQDRVLKIVVDNRIVKPLNLKQSFKLEALIMHYDDFKNTFSNSSVKTRSKGIKLPRIQKSIIFKNGNIVALKAFNSLPKELKVLGIKNKKLL